MPKITIHNVETGEVVERELTKSESDNLAQLEAADAVKMEERRAEIAAKQVVIEKLGITAAEAKLLLA
jgi:hypothetical protein